MSSFFVAHDANFAAIPWRQLLLGTFCHNCKESQAVISLLMVYKKHAVTFLIAND